MLGKWKCQVAGRHGHQHLDDEISFRTAAQCEVSVSQITESHGVIEEADHAHDPLHWITMWEMRMRSEERGDNSMEDVDHAFSITEDDSTSSYAVHNSPPIKEISLAVVVLVFGTVGIVVGFIMMYNKIEGDQGHEIFSAILGGMLFIPGFYYTRLAYYAYKGYKGFSFSSIPPI